MLEQGGWVHLNLPAEFEGEKCHTVIGWSDPRGAEGELLWPARFGVEEIAGTKRVLGSYAYAAQFQQRPSPAGGGIFQRQWWRYWRPAHLDLPPVQVRIDGEVRNIPAVPLPERFDQVIQSWDLSFKDVATADFVVGQVWGALKADRFLLDQRRDRLDMPKTKAAIKALSEKWPEAGVKLVEDTANGPAVLSELRHDISGLIAVNPDGGKVARAQAVSPQCESGNVFLPHPAYMPWADNLIEELASFPSGKHDDQVDSLSQALNRLRSAELPYGLIVYLGGLQERAEAERKAKMPPPTGIIDTARTAGVISCPECESVCVATLHGGEKRCAMCGHQWDAILAIRYNQNRNAIQHDGRDLTRPA